jgi:hypothetical protein
VAPAIAASWFVEETQRVLADRGLLLGVLWNRHSARGAVCRLKYRLNGGRDGRYFYTHSYGRWRRNLTAAGFQLVHEEGFCWGPFGRTSNSPLIPAFTRLERLLGLNRLVLWSPWIIFIARKTVGGGQGNLVACRDCR